MARLLVGLDEAALLALATAPAGSVMKAARPSLRPAIARGGWAATTVSATMIAAHAAGIRDVRHRRNRRRASRRAGRPDAVHSDLDISSDLEELARTPMAVVCAGPKAILDVPETLEVLETRGVPVVAIGQAELPGFTARSAGISAPWSVPDDAAAAALAEAHSALGLGVRSSCACPFRRTRRSPKRWPARCAEQAARDAEGPGSTGRI